MIIKKKKHTDRKQKKNKEVGTKDHDHHHHQRDRDPSGVEPDRVHLPEVLNFSRGARPAIVQAFFRNSC